MFPHPPLNKWAAFRSMSGFPCVIACSIASTWRGAACKNRSMILLRNPGSSSPPNSRRLAKTARSKGGSGSSSRVVDEIGDAEWDGAEPLPSELTPNESPSPPVPILQEPVGPSRKARRLLEEQLGNEIETIGDGWLMRLQDRNTEAP